MNVCPQYHPTGDFRCRDCDEPQHTHRIVVVRRFASQSMAQRTARLYADRDAWDGETRRVWIARPAPEWDTAPNRAQVVAHWIHGTPTPGDPIPGWDT